MGWWQVSASSLIVGGIDVLGDTTDPEFQLTRDYDLGFAEPDTAEIVSLFLDGSRITGERSRNRQITLKVWVLGRTQLELASLVARLERAVDQPEFAVTFTPAGGLTVIFDCYRAAAQREWDFLRAQGSLAAVTLTCQAAPFGRSDTGETIDVSAAQVQIDGFEAYTGTRTFSLTPSTVATALVTSPRIEATRALRLGWSVTSAELPTATLTVGLGTTLDLSTKTAVQVFVRSFVENLSYGGNVTAVYSLTLLSNAGARETTYRAQPLSQGLSTWTKVAFPLDSGTTTTGKLGVDLTAVTSYRLAVDPGPHTFRLPGANARLFVYLDDLRAMPAGSAVYSNAEGGVYSIDGVKGTARTPVALTLSQPDATDWNGVLIHRQPVPDPAVLPIVELARPLAGTQTVVLPPTRRFRRGSYDVVLVSSIGGGAYVRTYRVTITQTTPIVPGTTASGSTTKSVSVSRTFGPRDIRQGYNGGDGANGAFVLLGRVELPVLDIPADNTASTYSIQVEQVGSSTDFFFAVLLLDKAGQTYLVTPEANARTFWVDPPTGPADAAPRIYQGRTRANAVAVIGETDYDGGLLHLSPGSNQLTVYSPQGAPTLTASYMPRWRTERVS